MKTRKFFKKVIRRLDEKLETDFLRKARKLEKFWYDFFGKLQIKIAPTIVKLKYKLGIKDKSPSKLHLGCGGHRIDGYVNVDWRMTPATDLICDIRNLPFGINSAEIIECYHVIEHLPRHDLVPTFEKWYKILAPGGKLIVECPDFDEAVKEYLEGNEERLNNIFGLSRYPGDIHYFGYNFKRLKKILEEIGFVNIEEKEPQDYHSKEESCLRIECTKP